MVARNRKLQLWVSLLAAIGIASIGSHAMVRLLGIRTGGVGYRLLAPGSGAPLALAEGSSLMASGISWELIAKEVGMGIENWFVAGSSPSEWESLMSRSPQARLRFIVVSAYDLNENFLCDYRAAVVPMTRSASDLRESRAAWQFSKRMLSQYPMEYVRALFPTVGRSDGVMVGLRDLLRRITSTWVTMESEAGPTIASRDDGAGDELATELVGDWPKDRVLRRMALMRAACQGKHSFDGPKKLALWRILRQATQQGRTIVVVLPVSPMYTEEFLTSEVVGQFEASLFEARRNAPEALWLRLDKVRELNSNDNFWDFVHMNVDGQRIATEAFLSAYRKSLNGE